MIPAAFDYFRPSTFQEALEIARGSGSNAKYLAGGQSLLPLMKLRLASPETLIDLAGISALKEIRVEGGRLSIGAMVTHHRMETSREVRTSCPLLAQTATEIGDPQVRNCGTIGGSIAHADPAADYPAALMALDAEIDLQGPSGCRSLPVSRFFTGLMTTDLQEGELITAIRVPLIDAGTATSYQKLRHPASGFAIAGAAAIIAKDDAGKCLRAALALTGVGPNAFRAAAAEKALAGKSLTARTIRGACRDVASGIDVQGDIYASAEYRTAMAEVFATRAVAAAAGVEL